MEENKKEKMKIAYKVIFYIPFDGKIVEAEKKGVIEAENFAEAREEIKEKGEKNCRMFLEMKSI